MIVELLSVLAFAVLFAVFGRFVAGGGGGCDGACGSCPGECRRSGR